MKEKDIENAIYNFLVSKGAWVEKMQWGKVLVKKAWYQHMMTLQTIGSPDIIAFYNNQFIAIEVKKTPKDVDDWIKKEKRYKESWVLPKSYTREINQIKHKIKIMANWWTHIITCDLGEVREYINNL